jgi:hypothetical protein
MSGQDRGKIGKAMCKLRGVVIRQSLLKEEGGFTGQEEPFVCTQR